MTCTIKPVVYDVIVSRIKAGDKVVLSVFCYAVHIFELFFSNKIVANHVL